MVYFIQVSCNLFNPPVMLVLEFLFVANTGSGFGTGPGGIGSNASTNADDNNTGSDLVGGGAGGNGGDSDDDGADNMEDNQGLSRLKPEDVAMTHGKHT